MIGFIGSKVMGLCVVVCLASSAVIAQDLEPLEPPPENPNAPKRKMLTPEETIQFFQKKIEKSPKNTFLLTKLGMAYLYAARETGQDDFYLKAEAEFQKVLKQSPKNNAVKVHLASAFMAQHRFREALELSQAVYRAVPNSTIALANIGDAQLELGQYDEAEQSYQTLEQKVKEPLPEVLARLARLAELKGEPDKAIKLLKQALKIEMETRPVSSEIAWYNFRLGEAYFNTNQIPLAEKHFQEALNRREKYVAALLGLGQVRAAQVRYDDAAALYEQVIAQKPDFDLIADMGQLYALAGNKTKAQELEAKAISLIPEAKKIETEARHLALFLADREIQLDLALESARKELKVRGDVHAYDVLAWSLLKKGETQAAAQAMEKALRLGTKDARMHFHAGMIAKQQGNLEDAKLHLEMALKINPHFGFTDPDLARKTLAEMKASN